MSQRKLSPDALLVAKAIAAMEKLQAEGWKYDWSLSIWEFGDTKSCCLRGALILTAGRKYSYRVSDIARKLHWPDGELAGADIAETDWSGIKTALRKKYNLGVLA